MLAASYNVHHLIRRTFGQVPGGMFGADENARMGYIDPRQGVETCGMVEQMASDEIMLKITGDPFGLKTVKMLHSIPIRLQQCPTLKHCVI
mgnify:FL=1